MATKKILIASVGAILILGGCDKKDPIYETDHPEQGQITVTMDWSNIGKDITKPAEYVAMYGDTKFTAKTDRYTFPNLLKPGGYTLYFYNEPDNMTVTGTTATAAYPSGAPGWLFAGKLQAEVKADTDHEFTVKMEQQVRQLTLLIEPDGGTADKIESISATLSGVAGSLNMDDNTHSAPTNAPLTFVKGTDGKWTATVRLLGVAGNEQKLTGTVTFAGGNPQDLPLTSDLTNDLATFNADKKTPLTLGGQIVETPTPVGITGEIIGWEDQGSYTGDAEEQLL